MKMEEQLLCEIEEKVTQNNICAAAKYINKAYNIFSTDEQLWEEVKYSFGEECYSIFEQYSSKMIANRFINQLLFRYYPSERIIKYALVDNLRRKHDTVLFEMPVLDSRIDVCRINGNSYAYEIKTEFDTVKRLGKQMQDYSKVYEYVYVVIPPCFYEQVLGIIPEYCGIKIIKHEENSDRITFYSKRKATKSPNIDSLSQLTCLSKESLGSLLRDFQVKKIPPSKEGRINEILNRYSDRTINSMFKAAVKQIYKENWNFLVSHYDEILPIDFQAFFSSPLDPKLLYLKNEC